MHRTVGRNRLFYLLFLGTFGCTKSCSERPTPAATSTPEAVGSAAASDTAVGAGGTATLPFDISLERGGLRLLIGAVPDGATLTCHLNGSLQDQCQDQAVFPRPEEGEHVLIVKAVKDGAVIAQGTQTFVVPGAAKAAAATTVDPLALSLSGADFQNGRHLAAEETVSFKLAVPSMSGCKTVLNCVLAGGGPKDACKARADGEIELVAKDLPEGLVTFAVDASCGGRRGAPLTLYVYRDAPAGSDEP